jgi:ankyrin repeat protein
MASRYHLLSLPLEILQAILCTAVVSNGVVEALRLRLVCKAIDREIPGALSQTQALEDLLDKPVGRELVSEANITTYLQNRALADGRSKQNLMGRFHQILDSVLGKDQLLDSHRISCLGILIYAYLRNNHIFPHYRTSLLNPESLDHLSAEKIAGDIFQANILFNTCGDIEQSILRQELTKRGRYWFNIAPPNGPGAVLTNSMMFHASIAGNSALIAQILLVREELGSLPLGSSSVETCDEIFASICCAMHAGHDEIVRLLLDKKYLGTLIGRNGPSSLRLVKAAAFHGTPEMVQFVCDACEISITNPFVIIEASSQGRIELIQWLISQGADVNQRIYRDSFQSPIAKAAEAGHTELVRVLISHGAKVQICGDKKGVVGRQQPLFWAAMHGHIRIVQILLDAGASILENPNGEEWGNSCPVLAAARNGHASIVSLLLSSRPCEEATKIEALKLAVQRGFETLVRELVVGCQLNIAEADLSMWLVLSSLFWGHPHITRTLVELGAKPIDLVKSGLVSNIQRGDFPKCKSRGVRPVLLNRKAAVLSSGKGEDGGHVDDDDTKRSPEQAMIHEWVMRL